MTIQLHSRSCLPSPGYSVRELPRASEVATLSDCLADSTKTDHRDYERHFLPAGLAAVVPVKDFPHRLAYYYIKPV